MKRSLEFDSTAVCLEFRVINPKLIFVNHNLLTTNLLIMD